MNKPKVQLIGQDGNVFSIMGKAVRAAREAGWSETRIGNFLDDMKSGNYKHALRVVHKHFDVI